MNVCVHTYILCVYQIHKRLCILYDGLHILNYSIDYPMSIGTASICNLLPECTEPEVLRVKVSPLVVVMSGNVINVTCGAVKNGQMLYNAMYQFFLSDSPIGAPTNSSYIMVNATSSGNFTCNATQYSDQGTPIPSQLSARVQAIVLGESIFMQYTYYNIQTS